MEKVDYSMNFVLPSLFWEYFALLKPRVVLLVLFTALCAVIIAFYSTSTPVDSQSALIALFCIACGSGGAGAINMWYDRDIDCIMSRTKLRPIPNGAISPNNAILFGLSLSVLSVAVMIFAVNIISGALLAFAIFYYSVIYTMLLKRSTAQNIVIGGAAGAFPPIIGWSSVTGCISLESIVLFLIIFFWTPPHFWALGLKSSSDYKLAGIPMLPVTSGHLVTKIYIIIYSVILALVALLPCILGFSGILYLIISVLLNSIFVWYSIIVYKNEAKCMKMFYFSVLYLFLLFGAIVVDKIVIVYTQFGL